MAPHQMTKAPRILYCHCAYAQVVPKEVKEGVLKELCEAGVAFEAVADLCEMSARHDSALKRLAADGSVKIAACYPRAVKWLFAAAKAPLAVESTQVLNMRTQSAAEITDALMSLELQPNLPPDKGVAPAAANLARPAEGSPRAISS